MLTAYLVLLCEFFWEFSIFHFCRPLVIYWHLLLIRHRNLWLFFKKNYDDSNIESYCVTNDARHPGICMRKKQNRDTWLKIARLSPFVPFGLVLVFQAWLWPFWPRFGFFDTLITWLFAKKMSFVFSHRTVNMIYKRVCRNCPISSCGAKYLVRLANHFADVHQLDH